jgi:DNA-binding HxlR family transcriptional regulator
MSREYGQFCGLARAMELVGGRWTLLIVRDLLTGPKRFKDLRAGLPGIPTNMLSGRLRELEASGIVERTVQPLPASGVAYQLTEYGTDLERAVVALGVWGARSMGPPTEDDFMSVEALGLGLRGMFVAEQAEGLDCNYELRFDSDVLRVVVRDRELSFDPAADAAPDVVIATNAGTLHEMLIGAVALDDAVKTDRARVEGSRQKARRFFDVFRIGAPVPS